MSDEKVEQGDSFRSTLDVLSALGESAPPTPGSITSPPDGRTAVFGRYHAVRELGAGGMGRVLEAHDPELLRSVAVKILKDPGEAERGRVSRFVGEAQVTGQLDHPNIVPVHDLSVSADGGVFFVMKKVDGVTLKEAIQRHSDDDPAWSLHRLLGAFVQVCNAVAYAHTRGVLHRDLKPENIMLGEFGEVLVMDWGVARLMGDRSEQLPSGAIERVVVTRTQDGQAIGTPGFMSPEQARGELHLLDGRSDVWSLGAILYELLTGTPPYQGTTALQLMFAAATGPPEPPSQRAPSRAIHPHLEEIALRALQADRDTRQGSATALGAEVDQWIEGSKRRAEEEHRRRARLLGMVVALVVLTAVAVALAGLWRRAESAKADAIEARAQAQQEAILSEARALMVEARPEEAVALLRAELDASALPTAPLPLALSRSARTLGSRWVLPGCGAPAFQQGFTAAPHAPWLALPCGLSVKIVDAATGRTLHSWSFAGEDPPIRFWVKRIAWSDDGSKLVALGHGGGAVEVDVATGDRRPLLPADESASSAFWFGGRWLLLRSRRLVAVAPGGGVEVALAEGVQAVGAWREHLVFARGDELTVADNTGEVVRRVPPPAEGRWSWGLLPSGELLRLGRGDDGRPELVVDGLTTGSDVRSTSVRFDHASFAAWSVAKDRLLLGNSSEAAAMYRLSDLTFIKSYGDVTRAHGAWFDERTGLALVVGEERALVLDALSGVELEQFPVPRWDPGMALFGPSLLPMQSLSGDEGVPLTLENQTTLVLRALPDPRAEDTRDVRVDAPSAAFGVRTESDLAAGSGRSVRLWEEFEAPRVEGGRVIGRPRPGERAVIALQDNETGEVIRTFDHPDGWRYPGLAEVRAGRLLITGTDLETGNTARVLDTATGELVGQGLPYTDRRMEPTLLSLDGQRVAVLVGRDRTLLVQAVTAAEPARWTLPEGEWVLRSWRDAQTVLIAARDGRASAVDVHTGALLWTLPALEGPSVWPAVERAGELVVVWRGDGVVIGVDAATGAERWRRLTGVDSPGPILVSPDQTRLLARRDSDAWLLAVDDGSVVRGLRYAQTIERAAFSADGGVLALKLGQQSIELLDAPSGATFHRAAGRTMGRTSIAFAGRNPTLVVAGNAAFPVPYLRTLDGTLSAGSDLERLSGARTNLRRCRGTLRAVPVLPFPDAGTIWAPEEDCAGELRD